MVDGLEGVANRAWSGRSRVGGEAELIRGGFPLSESAFSCVKRKGWYILVNIT